MNKYELVIIWDDSEKTIYQYETEEKANRAGHEMKKAFGNQISWYGVRKGVQA